MSIILDALNKAQKAKSGDEKVQNVEVSNEASGIFKPKETDVSASAGNPNKTKIIILTLVAIVGLGVVLFNSFGSKLSGFQGQAKVQAPKALVPVSAKSVAAIDKVAKAKKDESSKTAEKLRALKKEAARYFDGRKYDKATYVYKSLVNQLPTDAQIYNNYGLSLKKLGKLEAAKKSYLTALALKPDYPEALNNLAVVEISERHFAQARLRLKKAIESDPEYLDPYLHMAICLEKSGDLMVAKKFYNEFLDRSEGRIDRKIRLQIESRLARIDEEM